MQDKATVEPNGSAASGINPAPTGVETQATAADADAERDARRNSRNQHRAAPAARPGVLSPNRRGRLPLEAPLMRVVATAGIVAIGVVIAAIMGSQNSQGWIIGLVVSPAGCRASTSHSPPGSSVEKCTRTGRRSSNVAEIAAGTVADVFTTSASPARR